MTALPPESGSDMTRGRVGAFGLALVIIGVLTAAVVAVLITDFEDEDGEEAAAPTTSSTAAAVTTTFAPEATTTVPVVPTTTAPVAPTTTVPSGLAQPGTGVAGQQDGVTPASGGALAPLALFGVTLLAAARALARRAARRD